MGSSGAEEVPVVDPVEAARLIREALRDEKSGPISGSKLREALRCGHDAVATGHRALTQAWGSPLSLFSAAAEAAALKRGVPADAVSAVSHARALVDEAAALGDRTDAYEAQIVIARRENRGVRRDALLGHLDALEELAGRLRGHLPCIVAARAAFDGAARSEGQAASAGAVSVGAVGSRRTDAEASQLQNGEASIVILEPARPDLVPQSLKNFWRSLRSTSHEYVPRALELAVDLVDKVCQVGPGPPPFAATGASSTTTPVADRSMPARVSWDIVAGRPSAWLGLESMASPGRVAALPQDFGLRAPAEGTNRESAQALWERCRRKGDRRWTLA